MRGPSWLLVRDFAALRWAGHVFHAAAKTGYSTITHCERFAYPNLNEIPPIENDATVISIVSKATGATVGRVTTFASS